jgi:flavin-binding protein dodecin
VELNETAPQDSGFRIEDSESRSSKCARRFEKPRDGIFSCLRVILDGELEREAIRVSVVKVLEVVGQSTTGWEDAAKQALSEAAKDGRRITGVEVVNWTGNVEGNSIKAFRADVRVAYVED